jgi:ubiquinone/menaquinone biosynthesis C-methylase UbiE
MAERAGIRSGDRILDAGCGVGGPAIAIARAIPDVSIDGVTISPVQVRLGRKLVAAAGLSKRIRIHEGDFHDLRFPDDSFDQVIMLEVSGYSYDQGLLYREMARVLRPGGRLYVKDVFRRHDPLTEAQSRELEAFDELWSCEASPTVAETTTALAAAGFIDPRVGDYPYVGTNRFVGAMFDLDQDGLRLSPLGEAFFSTSSDLPVFFAEVRARLAPTPAG